MKKLLLLLFIVFYFGVKAQLNTFYTFIGDTYYNADGANPIGSLYYDGVYLYGMTATGGTNNMGTIYKIKPDGSNYTKMFDFTGPANGRLPKGSLISDGTFLYGMTYMGGQCPVTPGGLGTIFKIMPDGTGFDTILNFHYTNGANPYGSLYYDGNYLYGMSYNGGFSRGFGGTGNIFKLKTDGTNYDTLLNFNYVNGNYPQSSFIADSTYLYGMTSEGGTHNYGIVFKIKPDGTGYDSILNLTQTTGGSPIGSLISDGTFLYGFGYSGGTGGYGTIFKVKKDGTSPTTLFNFNGANGKYPQGTLYYDGLYLYGTTSFGGIKDSGIVFRIKPDGTDYLKLVDFKGPNGGFPGYGSSFVSDGTYLYSVTANGGAFYSGTIFKIAIPPNIIIATASSNTICPGQTTTLTANGATNYTWMPGGTTTNTISVQPTTTTTYTLMTTAGTSIIDTTITIYVAPTPVVSYSIVPSVTPHIWYLYPSYSGGTPPYNAIWNWGDSTTTTGLYLGHTYSHADMYNICVTLVDTNGCTASFCQNDSIYRMENSSTVIQINVINGVAGIDKILGDNKINIYPNPTVNLLQVTLLDNTKIIEADITDMLGNELIQTNIKYGKTVIDVSNLATGIYFIKTNLGIQKFIKQ